MDNLTFADNLTNWAGGDLIIKEDARTAPFSATAALNVITVGDNPCATQGQGYIAGTDGKPNEIGCVLRGQSRSGDNLPPEDVQVSVNGGPAQTVGTITYRRVAFNMGTDNGATEKASMKQGEVRILTDTRCSKNGGNADCGYIPDLNYGQYRVKKMPDGNVWMIDNLAYTPQSGTDYNASTGIDAIVGGNNTTSEMNKAQYITTGADLTVDMGYLYNWCAATADTSEDCDTSSNLSPNENMPTSISPQGFQLPTGGSSGEFKTLNDQMLAAAATNPVYNATTAQNNWNNRTISPFQGSLSGDYNYGLLFQDSLGDYWSSTADSGAGAYILYFDTNYIHPDFISDRANGFAVRSVLRAN